MLVRMWVVVTMVMVMVVVKRRLVGMIACSIMCMVLRLPMNLYHRLNCLSCLSCLDRRMCVLMWMIVRMIMVVVMRHGVVMVMPAHAIFDAKLTVFTTIARHQRLRFAALQTIHAFFQQLKNLTLKTKVGG